MQIDNLTRCQIAIRYSDKEGYMFVPGYFEEFEFRPLWEKAVKSLETPDGWFCVGAFGGTCDQAVKALMAVGGGVPASWLKDNRQ